MLSFIVADYGPHFPTLLGTPDVTVFSLNNV
jgi:hypothetical protein